MSKRKNMTPEERIAQRNERSIARRLLHPSVVAHDWKKDNCLPNPYRMKATYVEMLLDQGFVTKLDYIDWLEQRWFSWRPSKRENNGIVTVYVMRTGRAGEPQTVCLHEHRARSRQPQRESAHPDM